MPHRSTTSRNNLKVNNPAKYAEYLQKQKETASQRRKTQKKELQKKKPAEWALEKYQKELELQRKRQQKYLKKKEEHRNESNNDESILVVKLPAKKTNCPYIRSTRHSISSKKEYNKLMKRKERVNMNYQKKMWCRKKDRERKRAKRLQMLQEKERKLAPETSTDSSTCQLKPMTPFNSKKTEWNITTNIRNSLPSTPSKCAKILENIVNRNTPQKKKALKDMIKNQFESRREKKEAKKEMNRRVFTRHLRRKSSIDSLKVKTFYMRQDISRILPQKRYATKQGPGFAMQVSLKAAYSKFVSENTRMKLSLSKFAKCRPRNVRTISHTHREYCCCLYCLNIRFKLLSLSRATQIVDRKKTNENDLPNILLCPKSDTCRFLEPDCINGNCEKCSGKYINALSKFYEDIPENKILNWSRWIKEERNGKIGRIVVTERGNKHELIKEMVEKDVLKPAIGFTFLQHLFTGNWQSMMFSNIKENLPSDTSLQILDFAKNRAITYQDEIKSAYYTQQQITLHPVVSYYKDNSNLKREAVVVISEDNTHDFHAVNHYVKLVNEVIEKDKQFKRRIVFSDGCSSQYKSKGPFADLANTRSPVNRNYFGSEHGKNECDGETGVLNRAVDRAIIGNKVIINNAEDMFKFCKENLEINEPLSKRSFLLVRTGEINRTRAETDIKTVPSTRKFHQVLNIEGETERLKCRNLSCFCKHCEAKEFRHCLNAKYVKEFELKELQRNEIKRPDIESHSSENSSKTDKEMDRASAKSDECSNLLNTNKNYSSNNRKQFFSNVLTQVESATDFVELQYKCIDVSNSEFDNLPNIDTKTFCNTNKVIDNNSLPLVPEDIPLKPTAQLYPCSIYGDGNCLPRTASFLAYGHEDNHVEMRQRIVKELTQNEELYLNNEKMKQGKHPGGNDNVTQMFASYSPYYMADRLTTQTIRSIYRKEILQIRKVGQWMGLWQLSSLANIFKCPVVSVCPEYGSNNTRQDMHRIFYPFQDFGEEKPVFIMWTNINGIATERDFVLNHFTAMIPFDEDVQISDSEYDESSNNGLNIDNLLYNLMSEDNDSSTSSIYPIIRGEDDQPPSSDTDPPPSGDMNNASSTSSIYPIISSEDDQPPSSDTDPPPSGDMNNASSFQITGSYVLINHGSNYYPAVVTNWPWVKFYHKANSKSWWIENEKCHTVLQEDVIKQIKTPDIQLHGCRIYFKFEDI